MDLEQLAKAALQAAETNFRTPSFRSNHITNIALERYHDVLENRTRKPAETSEKEKASSPRSKAAQEAQEREENATRERKKRQEIEERLQNKRQKLKQKTRIDLLQPN